jgi:hypothetical protein
LLLQIKGAAEGAVDGAQDLAGDAAGALRDRLQDVIPSEVTLDVMEVWKEQQVIDAPLLVCM